MPTQGNDTDRTGTCLRSLRTHWAQAQIDGPMQTIARYDEAAKILITIGGFVLGGLAAIYSEMIKNSPGLLQRPLMKPVSILILILISMFFFFTGWACFPQPKSMAGRILALKGDEDLNCEVRSWCDDVDEVIGKKTLRLRCATLFFALSFLVMVFFLLKIPT